jgi:N-acetylglutamate synthase-like GNAT family acetyltransferase
MLYDRTARNGTVRVRNAIGADAGAIQALYRELVPGDAAITVPPDRLARIAEDPNTLLLVAETGGCVQASALITFCIDAMYREQPYGLVENVIVTASARSTGIGRALMAAIDAVAVDRDCSKLMPLSNSKRLKAHDFFSKCGFDGAVRGREASALTAATACARVSRPG